MSFYKYLTVFLLMLVSIPISYATNLTDDKWTFEIAPYLWALNMDGRVQVASQAAHVSENFSDIMKQFDGGGMLWLSAHKNKLGFFANGMYASLSKSSHIGPISMNQSEKFGIFGAGISYELYKQRFASQNVSIPHELTVEPYLGFRYTLNNATVKIGRLSASSDHHWTDPIVGARVKYTLTKAWLVLFAGDVGGTNFNNHNSYDLNGLVGYKPQTFWTNTTVYAGYRFLHQNYVTGSGRNYFAWNMKLFGPVVGLAIGF